MATSSVRFQRFIEQLRQLPMEGDHIEQIVAGMEEYSDADMDAIEVLFMEANRGIAHLATTAHTQRGPRVKVSTPSEEHATEEVFSARAIIQAGGKGTRLRPYNMILPKPLMPVGSQPVLELLLKWLRRNGISNVIITIGHLGQLIRALCGNGRQWDMNIRYSEETQPLGAMGALTLMKGKIDGSLLVINGSVLTDLSINEFKNFHRKHHGLLSIAVVKRNVCIDFDVIKEDAGVVTGFVARPRLGHVVSIGIYCLEPEVLELIPSGIPFEFDDLLHCMLGKGLAVHTYLHNGLWLDIGRFEDFQKAQELIWGEGESDAGEGESDADNREVA